MAEAHDQEIQRLVREDDESVFARDESGTLVRLDDPSENDYKKEVSFTIDGNPVKVKLASPLKDANGNVVLDLEDRTTPRYTTIYDAAVSVYAADNPIPILCHQPHMKPVAVCRLCMVQIYKKEKDRATGNITYKPERKLLPACQYQIAESMDGMEVYTVNAKSQPDYDDDKKKRFDRSSDKIRKTVRTLTEMLAAAHLKPNELIPELSQYNELDQLAKRFKADTNRFKNELVTSVPASPAPLVGRRGPDPTSPVFHVDHTACVLCDRCVRACGEVKNNNIIGRTGKGYHAGIGFDLNDEMGKSGCVQCGECMVSCPTSAITFKSVVEAPRDRFSELIPAKDLLADPAFSGMPPKFLLWQQGLVLKRPFRSGDVLCRQGDPGNTAFLIKSGKLRVNVYDHAPNRNSLLPNVFGPSSRVVFSIDKTPANLIFGEMACLSATPRSGDVVGVEKGEVWELRRNVLDRMMRLPDLRARIETEFIRGALDEILRSSSLFKGLPKEVNTAVLAYLRGKISFGRINPGQTLCRQGDRGSEFYMIRNGFVRVNIATHGTKGSLVFSTGPGSILGEISLLGLTPRDTSKTPEEADAYVQKLLEKAGDEVTTALPAGFVTATCKALDSLELARLNRKDFLVMVRDFPIIRRRLVTQALQRLKSAENPNALMEEFVGQGLYEAKSVLVMDLEACTRCDECTRGCVHNHGSHSHGVPMTRMLRDGKRFGNFMVATSCRSCTIPHCMTGCPVDSIHRGRHMQIVIEDHCIGCGLCATNCPYGSISIQPNRHHTPGKAAQKKAINCDLCDAENKKVVPQPACVASCPHDAAFRMTGEQLLMRVQGREVQEVVRH